MGGRVDDRGIDRWMGCFGVDWIGKGDVGWVIVLSLVGLGWG